jgi:hypothetical protein
MSAPAPELWTPAEFAAYAKLTPHQVGHLRRSGKGPAFTRLGKHVRYVPGVCHRWIIDNMTTTTPKDTQND